MRRIRPNPERRPALRRLHHNSGGNPFYGAPKSAGGGLSGAVRLTLLCACSCNARSFPEHGALSTTLIGEVRPGTASIYRLIREIAVIIRLRLAVMGEASL